MPSECRNIFARIDKFQKKIVNRSNRGAVGKIAKIVMTVKPIIKPTPIIAVMV